MGVDMEGVGAAYRIVPCDGEDGWHAARMEGVGGSDVAAILGLSPWRTAYELWLEKTGQRPMQDISGNPAVEWGKILEPIIGGHYAAMHPDRTIERVDGILRSIERPWAQASLDYAVRSPEGMGVLEVKTASYMSASKWEDGVPIYYLTQVQHYLSVTGWKWADVAVLIGGQDYREYRVERDEDDMAAIARGVDQFWIVNVKERTAPEIRASDSQAFTEMHGHPEEGYEVAERPDSLLIDAWLMARDNMREAKEQLDECAIMLKRRIGDSKGIEDARGRITWVRGESRKLNAKRMRDENPEMYDEYAEPFIKDSGLRFKSSDQEG